MASLLQFVDSISSNPTVLLDINDGSTWKMLEGTDFPPPPMEQVFASTLLVDGAVNPASKYGLRTLTLELGLKTSSADSTATALQSLFRELDRPENLIRWQPQGVTEPMFFRTFRTSASSVQRYGQPNNRQKTVMVDIRAEHAAYGLLETPVPAVTVSTDPAATNNGCFVDVDFAVPSNANPYFETDVTNWSGLNGASLSRSTAQFHEGVASMLITPDGSTADPQAQSEAIVVTGGQSWFASAWLRSPGTPTVGATIRWYSDAGGSAFISDSQFLAALTANTWTYSSVTGVAPANALSARLVVKYSGTPSAGTTLFVDEAILGPSQGIKGDVESPAIIRWPSSALADEREAVFATRRRGTPSLAPFWFQAEAMTQGTNTTTQPNEAGMSGSGNNFSRCTFATATMATRLSTIDLGTAGVDLRGRYRVLLRYRKNTSSDGINLRLRWGDQNNWLLISNDTKATPNSTSITTVDLGLISIPAGYDPVTDHDGTELPVSDSFWLALQAERTSGSGSIDFDFLMLVPADDRFVIVQWNDDAGSPSDHWILDANGNMPHARDASGNVISAGAPAIRNGGLPLLSPGATNRIVMLRSTRPTDQWTLTTVSPVSVSYFPRYLSVRPAST